MSIEGHSFSTSNIMTTDSLLINVALHNEKLRKENTNICTHTFSTKYDRNTHISYSHYF